MGRDAVVGGHFGSRGATGAGGDWGVGEHARRVSGVEGRAVWGWGVAGGGLPFTWCTPAGQR